jgi:hypothetical protein
MFKTSAVSAMVRCLVTGRARVPLAAAAGLEADRFGLVVREVIFHPVPMMRPRRLHARAAIQDATDG